MSRIAKLKRITSISITHNLDLRGLVEKGYEVIVHPCLLLSRFKLTSKVKKKEKTVPITSKWTNSHRLKSGPQR
ncbi:glycosyl hydrolase family 2 [Sesbania bispinosa]|nr:glycosyl hydrolase family 2 [Sesbania bispinosa]